MPDKMKMQAQPMDKVLEKVMAICPNAVQNGKVNIERLIAELADVADNNTKESYDFTWVGKRNAIVEANTPIRKTLRPAKDESKNWDTTENLYIEGDNLEALKLLQESYLGKVKMIYIDPPYNTGKDFIYKDNFTKSKVENDEEIGVYDDEGNKLFKNTESNGRFHSDWCSMIYPRLKLARDFLSDDGVIFISIDDNEVANLRKICDEVFGEDNFIRNVIWEKKYSPSNDSNVISDTHDHILVYSKNGMFWKMGLLKRTEKMNERYSNPDNDHRGPWKPGGLSAKSYSAKYDYHITTPCGNVVYPPTGSCWQVSREKLQELISDNRIYFGKKNNAKPQLKQFLTEVQQGSVPKSIWGYEEVGHNQISRKEVTDLFGVFVFDNPKPVELLIRTMIIGNTNNSLILDFFSGSATTAHAVMQLNAEDGGNRKFIMVQLPEKVDQNSNTHNVSGGGGGYFHTICDIGKERIRRAGEKIKTEYPDAKDLDIGFRVLKVDDTNMKDVYYSPSELTVTNLLDSVDNIKGDRTPLDLLFGIMIDWGLQLSLPISEKKFGKNTIYTVGNNDLVACFDNKISDNIIKEVAHLKPTRAVFRDRGFAKDDIKINMFELFKNLSPDTKIKVI